MNHKAGRALGARVVEAVDRPARDKRKRTRPGNVAFFADAQRYLALENIEEFVALPVTVRPRARHPGSNSSLVDRAQTARLRFRLTFVNHCSSYSF